MVTFTIVQVRAFVHINDVSILDAVYSSAKTVVTVVILENVGESLSIT